MKSVMRVTAVSHNATHYIKIAFIVTCRQRYSGICFRQWFEIMGNVFLCPVLLAETTSYAVLSIRFHSHGDYQLLVATFQMEGCRRY